MRTNKSRKFQVVRFHLTCQKQQTSHIIHKITKEYSKMMIENQAIKDFLESLHNAERDFLAIESFEHYMKKVQGHYQD